MSSHLIPYCLFVYLCTCLFICVLVCLFVYLFVYCTCLLFVCFDRISVRMEDTYLQIPGYHPMVDNPTFYRQRADNPQVLPSLHKHLWGRIASLGSLTLMAERGVYVVNGNQGNIVKFTNDPLTLSGEGGSLMLEWSQPTVVALARMLQHIQQQYRTVPVSGDAEKVRNSKGVDGDSVGAANWTAPSVSLKIQLSDVNAFVYGLTPGVCVCVFTMMLICV